MVRFALAGFFIVSLAACSSQMIQPNPQKNPQGAVACKQGDSVYYWNTGQLFKVNCGESTATKVIF